MSDQKRSAASIAVIAFLLTMGAAAENPAAERDDGAAAAAFEVLVPALRNPRCMNCHSTGDYPRQGNDSHRHTMDVRRGPGGDGVNAVKCSSCQDRNTVGVQQFSGCTLTGICRHPPCR